MRETVPVPPDYGKFASEIAIQILAAVILAFTGIWMTRQNESMSAILGAGTFVAIVFWIPATTAFLFVRLVDYIEVFIFEHEALYTLGHEADRVLERVPLVLRWLSLVPAYVLQVVRHARAVLLLVLIVGWYQLLIQPGSDYLGKIFGFSIPWEQSLYHNRWQLRDPPFAVAGQFFDAFYGSEGHDQLFIVGPPRPPSALSLQEARRVSEHGLRYAIQIWWVLFILALPIAIIVPGVPLRSIRVLIGKTALGARGGKTILETCRKAERGDVRDVAILCQAVIDQHSSEYERITSISHLGKLLSLFNEIEDSETFHPKTYVMTAEVQETVRTMVVDALKLVFDHFRTTSRTTLYFAIFLAGDTGDISLVRHLESLVTGSIWIKRSAYEQLFIPKFEGEWLTQGLVRATTLRALGEIAHASRTSPPVPELLIAALSDPYPVVRRYAAYALLNYNCDQVLEKLIDTIAYDHQSFPKHFVLHVAPNLEYSSQAHFLIYKTIRSFLTLRRDKPGVAREMYPRLVSSTLRLLDSPYRRVRKNGVAIIQTLTKPPFQIGSIYHGGPLVVEPVLKKDDLLQQILASDLEQDNPERIKVLASFATNDRRVAKRIAHWRSRRLLVRIIKSAQGLLGFLGSLIFSNLSHILILFSALSRRPAPETDPPDDEPDQQELESEV